MSGLILWAPFLKDKSKPETDGIQIPGVLESMSCKFNAVYYNDDIEDWVGDNISSRNTEGNRGQGLIRTLKKVSLPRCSYKLKVRLKDQESTDKLSLVVGLLARTKYAEKGGFHKMVSDFDRENKIPQTLAEMDDEILFLRGLAPNHSAISVYRYLVEQDLWVLHSAGIVGDYSVSGGSVNQDGSRLLSLEFTVLDYRFLDDWMSLGRALKEIEPFKKPSEVTD